MDLSNWMSELDEYFINVPLIHLAIPGSHDSLTYTIKPCSRMSPDADPPILQVLNKFFGPLVRKFMYNWCITQKLTVTQQLQFGIRYFDIRLATKKGEKGFYIVHGLYGGSVEKPLEEIAEFLKSKTGEICIVDLQHFYEFAVDDHNSLSSRLLKIFDGLLCPLPEDISTLTLDAMRRNNYRVIVVYRCNQIKENLLWNSGCLPTPWPNTMSPSFLVDFLSAGLDNRSSRTPFVSQCVLTPSRFTVLSSPWAGVHSKCAVPAAEATLSWLRSLPHDSSLNIAIADFVHDDDAAFPKAVIALNKKPDDRREL